MFNGVRTVRTVYSTVEKNSRKYTKQVHSRKYTEPVHSRKYTEPEHSRKYTEPVHSRKYRELVHSRISGSICLNYTFNISIESLYLSLSAHVEHVQIILILMTCEF